MSPVAAAVILAEAARQKNGGRLVWQIQNGKGSLSGQSGKLAAKIAREQFRFGLPNRNGV